MNWYIIAGATGFLAVVFSVLGRWHRRIPDAADREMAEKVRLAEESGTNQALTQHPQIDSSRCLGCGSCVLACHESGVLAVVDGKARLVNASGCVGHALCETVCPVGALTVGLGDVSQRDDLPLLTDERESTVPGVFIAGELGGIGLIRNAIAQGTEIVETIAARLKEGARASVPAEVVDVLIVGSGPAGLAAALKAHELGLRFEVIDQDDLGGTIRKYPRNKMTLTQPITLPLYGKMKRTQYAKEELIELWESIFKENGIAVKTGVKLTGLEPMAEGVLTAHTSAGVFRCRHCILALGRRGTPRQLDVPGEDSVKVLYQLVDVAEYSNENLLVVGGGDSAIEAALSLASQPGNRVVLSYRRHAFFRIKQRNRDNLEAAIQDGTVEVLFNSQVKSIDDGRTRLEIQADDGRAAEGRTVPADYVFVFAGGEPPYPLLKGIGIRFGGEAAEERMDEEALVAG